MAKEVVIVSAARTPIGSFLGTLSGVSAPKLGAVAIKAALERAGISGAQVDQVIFGNVLTAGVGQAPARQAMIFGGIPHGVGATTINKVCGSGLQAIALARQAILSGESEVVVAGGMENMSQAPHMQQLRLGTKMGEVKLEDSMVRDGLWDVYNQFHMGSAAEICVKEYKFTREEQDRFAQQSFERAQAAQKQGLFKAEIAAVAIPGKTGEILISEDEGPGKANFEKMKTLKPVFDKAGTITAANASTINDGASALIVMSADKAKALGVKPLARILSTAVHSQAPEWFTTAPVEATKKALARANLKVSDIDLFEVNEAFAVVALATAKGCEIPESKMNIWGGAISLGHPIGCSGSRIVTTLLHALTQQGKKRGLATLCIGGGEGIAAVIERI